MLHVESSEDRGDVGFLTETDPGNVCGVITCKTLGEPRYGERHDMRTLEQA